MKRLLFLSLILVAVARFGFAQSPPVVTSQISDVTVYGGGSPATIDLTQYFDDPATRSAVRMFTSLGELDVVLLPTQAPKTVANFLKYVNRGAYTSSLIHRSVPGFVIQGGAYTLSATPSIDPIPTDSPVPNEFKVSNTRGTIAMAKLGSDPNSATSQWFFNESDSNAANLDKQNGGFTVFGKLADYSLPAMDALAAIPVPSPPPFAAPLDQLPLFNYQQGTQVRPDQIVLVNQVATIPTVFKSFTVTSDHPEIANPVIQARNLSISTDAAHLGTAHLTVVANSFNGGSVSQQFAVNVTAAPGRPVNISTRLQVNKGDNVLIGGFIITGKAAKTVMIRGIGPSLASAGVANALLDPTLELHDRSGALIKSNDNWHQFNTDTQAIIDAGIAPTDTREAAIVATLQPDNYTAIVRGKSDTVGVGLVEVYDLDSGPGAVLANISTRGGVSTGENVLIGGFIVGGGDSRKILARAIGPSLSAAGVSGALPDPTLEIHNAQGTIIDANDNWQSSPQAQEIQASGVAPTDPKEAATVDVLAPGNYTAVVRGTGSTPTGIGLVEAYAL
jgi:cyclophilin family peptidyl-prolyl cis-trans isomerase